MCDHGAQDAIAQVGIFKLLAWSRHQHTVAVDRFLWRRRAPWFIGIKPLVMRWQTRGVIGNPAHCGCPHIANAGRDFGDAQIIIDGPIKSNLAIAHQGHQRGAGQRLGNRGQRIGRVGRGWNPPFLVRQTETLRPDNLSVFGHRNSNGRHLSLGQHGRNGGPDRVEAVHGPCRGDRTGAHDRQDQKWPDFTHLFPFRGGMKCDPPGICNDDLAPFAFVGRSAGNIQVPPMIPRYARDRMVSIWSPETKFRIWFEIEAHATDALAELGVVPKDAAAKVWEKGKNAKFDVARIDVIEREVKHDVIAFLTHLAEIVGPEARFVHQGMTSSDVLDTCLNVQLMRAADLLIADTDALLAALKTRAFEYKMTPTIGRSHGI